MIRYLIAIFLSLAVLAPARAQNPHEWNHDREDTAWRSYLKEKHKKNHEWEKASKRERKDYWKWRDGHQDVH